MHGDVLATRNVDGSTIQYVEAVDGVQTSAAGLRVSSSASCGRKRREEEMMDIVTNGKEEEEE